MSLHFAARLTIILTGIIALASSPVAYASESVRLNFGVYTSNKPSAMVKVFRPILEVLEANMSKRLERDVDIRMQIAMDYDQGIAHLVDGHVDFSAFGPASYVEAKRINQNIRILAIENVNQSKVFYGIIAVAANSEINHIQELVGRSFAFGDEGSTIGRFLSQLELEQSGIHANDLSRYEYLGRHDKVGTAVGAGSFDAGALNEKTFIKLVNSGVPIRELVRFPNVTKPWIARSGLDPEIAQALRDSLLEINDKETLVALKIDGFLEGSDEDYKIIRKAMEDNHVFFEEREKTIEVTAVNVQPEPALEAASTSNVSSTPLKDTVKVTHTEPKVEELENTTNSHRVNINISLPRDLFDTSKKKTGHAITINLTIPEELVAEQPNSNDVVH